MERVTLKKKKSKTDTAFVQGTICQSSPTRASSRLLGQLSVISGMSHFIFMSGQLLDEGGGFHWQCH